MVNAGWDGLQAVSLRCRSWGCPLCSESRRKQLVALAKSGDPNTFITLTVNPAFGSSPFDRAHRLADAWRVLIRLLKRRCRKCQKAHVSLSAAAGRELPFEGRVLPDGLRCCYGYTELPYFCVFEATLNGEPHLHILARVKWISQKWLSKAMEALISAPIVDIRRVKNKNKLAYYISKYCGKEPHRFQTCKRYWTTRDYELTRFEPEPQPGRWHRHWQLEKVHISQLADDWRSQGYEVTETRHRVLAWAQGPPDDEVAAFEYLSRRRLKGLSW